MPTVKIDGQDYDYDSLPKEAKDKFDSLQFVDEEFQRLNAQIVRLVNARAAYSKALAEIVRNSAEAPTRT